MMLVLCLNFPIIRLLCWYLVVHLRMWSDLVGSVRVVCARGLCAWSVRAVYARGLCARSVRAVCARGLCARSVRVVCARGLCA